jgi:hypothetical protein
MKVKLAWENDKREYMRAVEACRTKERYTGARTREVGSGTMLSPLLGLLVLRVARVFHSIARMGSVTEKSETGMDR